MFKIYDEVWVMKNNTPIKVMIYSIEERMDFSKKNTEKFFTVVNGTMSADTNQNPAVGYDVKNIFKEKSDLINSL